MSGTDPVSQAPATEMCWFCGTDRSVEEAAGAVELRRGAIPSIEADVLRVPRCRGCRQRWDRLWVVQGALAVLYTGLTAVWAWTLQLYDDDVLPLGWFVAAPITALLAYLCFRHLIRGATERIRRRTAEYPAIAVAEAQGWEAETMKFWS